MDKIQTYSVPKKPEERSHLRSLIDDFVEINSLLPPLSMDDLSGLSDRFITQHAFDMSLKGWVMVEINNCVWRETVAAVSYDKRILLLPKCLSNSAYCTADVDEFGLLCQRCTLCSIPDLQDMADELGMMSIVAEGFTTVIGLIENRIVDTVIGVSCLESLEKAFPLLIKNAVPGIAIPLNVAGCKDTDVDIDYVTSMIRMYSEKPISFLDYDHLKSNLKAWFSNENLKKIMSESDDQTSAIAQEWIGSDGKRWRPYLLAATYLALSGEKEIPLEVQLAAVAVECFHKASLVHDDIQDNDMVRYGKKTVNATYGIPVAINVGDVLLGEGYRLLTGCMNMELIKVASEAHIALCKGQGMELEWSNSPRVLSMDYALNIFDNKTVPAFNVSLAMGVICASTNKELLVILQKYSKALGLAYQLQDDLDDFGTNEPLALRPSAVLAAICEQQHSDDFIHELLHNDDLKAFLLRPGNKPFLDNALERVSRLAQDYHRQALDALNEITTIELKRLLFRVTKRILK